jgi:hypothetical protein
VSGLFALARLWCFANNMTDGSKVTGTGDTLLPAMDLPGVGMFHFAPQNLFTQNSASYNVPAGNVNSTITAIDVSDGVFGGITPYTYSIASTATWLLINTTTGVISGTRPATAQTATTANIAITDSAGTPATATITITVGAVSGGGGGGSVDPGDGGGSAPPPVGTSNATLCTSKADFDKNGGKDIAITLNRGSYTLNSITNGTYTLKSGTDYTVSGNTYTLKAAYLATLKTGEYSLSFNMNGGTNPKFALTVKASNPFKDISTSAWYYDAVMYVYGQNLMVGTAADAFSPTATLTRAMIVTILYRHAGEPSIDGLTNPFNDVPADQWYTTAIIWAANNGIVSGYGDGRFGTNDALTNEQLAALIHRTQQADKKIPPNKDTTPAMSDADKVSDWAKGVVDALNKQGIFDDIPGAAFNPQAPASRAEIASMLYKWLTAID